MYYGCMDDISKVASLMGKRSAEARRAKVGDKAYRERMRQMSLKRHADEKAKRNATGTQ